MAEVLFDTVKGFSVAVAHAGLVNLGLTLVDLALKDSVVSGTHLTALNTVQVIGGLSATSALAVFNSDLIDTPDTNFAYVTALTFLLQPVMGSKLGNIQSYILHETIGFFKPLVEKLIPKTVHTTSTPPSEEWQS